MRQNWCRLSRVALLYVAYTFKQVGNSKTIGYFWLLAYSTNCIKPTFAPPILRPLACCARGQLPPPLCPPVVTPLFTAECSGERMPRFGQYLACCFLHNSCTALVYVHCTIEVLKFLFAVLNYFALWRVLVVVPNPLCPVRFSVAVILLYCIYFCFICSE